MNFDANQLAQLAIENTILGYAREYIYGIGDDPEERFSFKGHNYLIDIYNDPHKYMVIEKSAQMGASVYAMAKSFFVCDKLGKNVIYFFPTDSDVQEFSKTRVAPLLSASPHLEAITARNDSQGLRKVGRGWMYFRGMRSSIAMKSVPADFLVFDELDEVSEDSEALADQRLNHSRLKWRLKLSTPTFEGYGIDRDFQKSDKRYWNLICKKCDTKNIMEFEFPDCVRIVSEVEAYLICKKCKSTLDTQYGVWIAENPKALRIRGYHICGLYSSYMDLAEIMQEYTEGRRRAEFYRSKLGIPFTEADDRVTPTMVQSCIRDYEMHAEENCYMGVDQKGDGLHIVIRKKDKFSIKSRVLFIGKVKLFGDLDYYIRKYDVTLCVIDGVPNQHSAREVAARFPGRVFMCYYNENQRGDYNWSEPDDKKKREENQDWQVVVNRTEALDAMYDEVRRHEIELPQSTTSEFISQLCALGRVNEADEDGTILKAVYKRLGEDHFAHANSYSLIAMSRYGGLKATAITVMPKSAARIQYARKYEGGSRF
jgi:hypothetical protein